MYRLSCEIEISTSAGEIRLDHATGVSIAKHADSLTDVATITLPRRIRWKGVESNPIKRGDAVSISLGYDGRNHLAFVGTVARVNPTTPMTVECQDPMAAWQTVSAKPKAYTSVTLSTLLSDQGVEATVMGSQALGAYRVECQTVSELFDALKKQGVRTMYRIGSGTEPKLYAGLLLKPDDARTFDFDDTRNVVNRSSLNYEPADDVRFLVRVKNHSTVESGKRKNAKMKPVEVGYTDGEVRTFNVIGMTESEMKEYAEAQLERLKQGGLSGSLTVFGGEIVDKLDAIRLTLDGKDAGTWQVDRNDITWGNGGFRQTLTVGSRLTT